MGLDSDPNNERNAAIVIFNYFPEKRWRAQAGQ
jgi:hypothetical protein